MLGHNNILNLSVFYRSPNQNSKMYADLNAQVETVNFKSYISFIKTELDYMSKSKNTSILVGDLNFDFTDHKLIRPLEKYALEILFTDRNNIENLIEGIPTFKSHNGNFSSIDVLYTNNPNSISNFKVDDEYNLLKHILDHFTTHFSLNCLEKRDHSHLIIKSKRKAKLIDRTSMLHIDVMEDTLLNSFNKIETPNAAIDFIEKLTSLCYYYFPVRPVKYSIKALIIIMTLKFVF